MLPYAPEGMQRRENRVPAPRVDDTAAPRRGLKRTKRAPRRVCGGYMQ